MRPAFTMVSINVVFPRLKNADDKDIFGGSQLDVGGRALTMIR